MAAQQHQQPSAPAWTEPPWSGWIETTGDALLILEAARRGLIPRVTRRLVDSERKMISSGSVFVFDEEESGIRRWTDGFFWSPSRILGNFLLYRETEKRGAGHRSIKADQELNSAEATTSDKESQTLSRPKNDAAAVDKHRERVLMGSLTNSYKFKPDGLMKKTFSLTIAGVAQHLISYYKIEDVENGRLRSPSSLPELASLDISPEYLDKTHFRNPPKVEIGVDGIPRYRGEAEDVEPSATTLPTAIIPSPLSSSGVPLLTDGRIAESNTKRVGKRYEPYGTVNLKRRKGARTESTPEVANSPVPSTSTATPPAHIPPAYHDPNIPMPMQPAYPPPQFLPPFYPYPPMYGPHQPYPPAPLGAATSPAGEHTPPYSHPHPYGYSPTPSSTLASAGPSPDPSSQVHHSDPSQAGPPPGSAGGGAPSSSSASPPNADQASAGQPSNGQRQTQAPPPPHNINGGPASVVYPPPQPFYPSAPPHPHALYYPQHQHPHAQGPQHYPPPHAYPGYAQPRPPPPASYQYPYPPHPHQYPGFAPPLPPHAHTQAQQQQQAQQDISSQGQAGYPPPGSAGGYHQQPPVGGPSGGGATNGAGPPGASQRAGGQAEGDEDV